MRIHIQKINRLAVAGKFFLFLCLCLSNCRLYAQPSSMLDPKFWFPAGPVNAMLVTNDTLYLGGDFSYVGPRTGPVAVFNQSSGGLEGAPPFVNGTVRAVVSDGSGGWFIGGLFTSIGNLAITNIAHLNSDLTVDTGWNPQFVGSTVNALAVDSGVLYIGGSISKLNGQFVSGGIIGVTVTNPVVTWNPTLSGSIYAIQVVSNLVWVGGNFYNIGNSNVQNLASISTTTALASAFNPGTVDSTVFALSVTASNVYVGGQFTTIGTKSKNRLAELDLTVGVATSWNPNPNGVVRAIAVTSSNVYVGGDFTTISVANRRGFASIGLTGAGTAQPLDLALQSVGTAGLVTSILVQSNSLYVGGQFTNALAGLHFMVVGLDTTTGKALPTPLGTDFNGGYGAVFSAYALASYNGNMMLGGTFQSIGGVARQRAAALSLTTGTALPWAPDFDAPVMSLAMGAGSVFVGGSFLSYNTTNDTPTFNPGLGAVDPVSGDPQPFTFLGTNIFGTVSITALAFTPGALYVGGNFPTVAGQARRFLAAVDPTSGNLISDFNANLGGGFAGISCMDVEGTNLYVGGDFTTVNLQAIPRLAALSLPTGANINWAPTPNQTVNVMSASADTLYVGGSFSSINLNGSGAITLNHFAAFSLADNSLVPLDASLNSFDAVTALGATETAVYVAGSFAAIGGNFTQNLGDISPIDATPYPWNPSPDVGPTVITLSDAYAFMGGTFRSYGVGVSNRIDGFFAAFDRGPQFIGAQGGAGNININFTTGDGTDAILQGTTVLNHPSWTNVQTFSTGFPLSVPLPDASGQQFYRLKAN